MSGILFRVVVTVVALVIFWNILGPLCALLGLPLNTNAVTVIRWCVAGLACFYILKGKAFGS